MDHKKDCRVVGSKVYSASFGEVRRCRRPAPSGAGTGAAAGPSTGRPRKPRGKSRLRYPIASSRRASIMTYIDGFVTAVPTANRDTYRKHAEKAAVVFKEHGALKLVECWGDDVPDGKLTSFPMAVKKKDDETVVFSWIVWPSRQARDEGMKKVMADPRAQPDVNPMPFDGKRLIFGGFKVLLEV